MQIQSCALNREGKVIRIGDVSDRKGSFFCPSCHDPVIPRMGKVRAWHFAHKNSACSYESYLHALAKIRVADWYNRSKSVFLELDGVEACPDYEECDLRDPDKCIRPVKIPYDLKKYYPSCETEKTCGGFVADILCHHKKSPLLIEIFVSHPCSEEKRKSGQRIIEFSVNSEEDIEKIVSPQESHPVIRASENTVLYGFRKPCRVSGAFEKRLSKFILYKSGKSYVIDKRMNCRNFREKQPGSVYEIIADRGCDPVLLHLIGKSLAYRNGYIRKNCSICLNLNGRLKARSCRMNSSNDNGQCRLFAANGDLISECANAASKWNCREIYPKTRFASHSEMVWTQHSGKVNPRISEKDIENDVAYFIYGRRRVLP